MEKVILKNDNLSVTILTLGATVQNITAYGVSLTAGFDTEQEYLDHTCYFGALVGRTANRTGNTNQINGETINLPLNEDGINHLHGGIEGFDKKRWTVEDKTATSVTLSYLSPDGEEGYPGNLLTKVTYSLVDDSLLISYNSKTDKPTWVNLTNHSYFNPFGIDNKKGARLGGALISVYADKVSVYDEKSRVIGSMPVEGTEFDLNKPYLIEHYYDHNFYLNGTEYKDFNGLSLRKAAKLSGTVNIETYTDLPCIQIYCGEFIPEGTKISGGNIIGSGSAICFETQLEPNFQARNENILQPNGEYKTHTAYRFTKGGIKII